LLNQYGYYILPKFIPVSTYYELWFFSFSSNGAALMSEISTLKQVYQAAVQPVENIPELVRALSDWYFSYSKNNYLHPCVIDGKPTLVYQGNLLNVFPQAFYELRDIADTFQIFLKEDSRSFDTGHTDFNRRKNARLVLVFCLNLIAASRWVVADEQQSQPPVNIVNSHPAIPIHTIEATVSVFSNGSKVISLQHAKLPTAKQIIEAYSQKKLTLQVDEQAEISIRNFLVSAYMPKAGDPDYVVSDLAKIAHYFASYPQVVELISELQQKKLMLKYLKDNWQTQAWGTQFQVINATIFFDTRIAARLVEQAECSNTPACDISPADALLHELLHAKLMLVDSQHFIDIGGMQQSLYPYEHEREVIANENQLYYDMNSQDGLSRPIRIHHEGTLYHVKCSACMPEELIATN
jgi:hypothetical protein